MESPMAGCVHQFSPVYDQWGNANGARCVHCHANAQPARFEFNPTTEQPWYVRGSDTSKAAADAIAPVRQTMAERVLKHIADATAGATSSEVCAGLNMRINSATARIAELQQAGVIRDSGLRRVCPSSGASKAVYVATGERYMPGRAKPLTKAQQARVDALLEVKGMLAELNEAQHGFLTLEMLGRKIDSKIKEMGE